MWSSCASLRKRRLRPENTLVPVYDYYSNTWLDLSYSQFHVCLAERAVGRKCHSRTNKTTKPGRKNRTTLNDNSTTTLAGSLVCLLFRATKLRNNGLCRVILNFFNNAGRQLVTPRAIERACRGSIRETNCRTVLSVNRTRSALYPKRKPSSFLDPKSRPPIR